MQVCLNCKVSYFTTIVQLSSLKLATDTCVCINTFLSSVHKNSTFMISVTIYSCTTCSVLLKNLSKCE